MASDLVHQLIENYRVCLREILAPEDLRAVGDCGLVQALSDEGSELRLIRDIVIPDLYTL